MLERDFELGSGKVGRYLKMCDRVHTDGRGQMILSVNQLLHTLIIMKDWQALAILQLPLLLICLLLAVSMRLFKSLS